MQRDRKHFFPMSKRNFRCVGHWLILVFLFLNIASLQAEEGKPSKPTLSVLQQTSSSVTLKYSGFTGTPRVFIASEPPKKTDQPAALRLELEGVKRTGKTLTIEGLAAGVLAFVQVQSGEGEALQLATTAIETVGGVRAKLDDALQQVAVVAPHILQVVFFGGDGPGWQSGHWTVTRADGRELQVKKIYRHSVPVGAPNYKIGFGAPASDEVIDVEHRLFLVLNEPIGSPEILRLRGPNAVNVVLPFSDRYLQTPVIQVNQVGYNPRAKKRYAYVYGYMGDGAAIDLVSFPKMAEVLADSENPLVARRSVLSGLGLQLRRDNDADAYGPVMQIRLSGLQASETLRYRVRLPGIGVSYPTAVSERAAFKAFYVATRGLFHNRWGGDLNAKSTDWTRAVDHPFVYTGEQVDFLSMYPKGQPKTGKRPLAGGYHDAGDFDQRPMHTVVPMLLMSAFELRSYRFKDGQLTLPESGNGVPDLLDEALWGVLAWEQLQEKDGSVRQGVESNRHPWGIYPADKDPLPYWTYSVSANVTARAAGLFAQAARLTRFYQRERSDKLTERAKRAYKYAVANNAAPADLLYASGELLLLTGEEQYRNTFDASWSKMGPYGAFNRMRLFDQPNPNSYREAMDNPQTAFAMVDYLLAYLTSQKASGDIKALYNKWMPQFTDGLIDTVANAHAHRNPRRENGSFDWGAGASLGRHAEVAVAALRLGGLNATQKQALFDALSLTADYILGCNPLGMVYYTGLGSRPVQEPLHLDSLVFIKRGLGPMPGIPVFGPVNGPPNPRYSQPAIKAFYPPMRQLPPALRYGDVRTLVVCNESTVWGDYAPNIKLFAALLGNDQMPPETWLPGASEHRSPLP